VVKSAAYYSVTADEVCDISTKKQLSISLFYALNASVIEVFMDFIPVARITGSAIADVCHCGELPLQVPIWLEQGLESMDCKTGSNGTVYPLCNKPRCYCSL